MALLCVSSFAATPQPVSLQGTIHSEAGSSGAFVTVMALTEDGNLFTTISDVEGRYSFAGLPPGKVKIVASKLVPGVQQTARVEATIVAGRPALLDIALPGVKMNQCNCACPWDPHKQYQYDLDCSPCSFSACP